MFNEIKFAFYSIGKNIKSSAELRTSFLMNVVGMMINNVAFIIIWVYFVKSVGIIGGWTTYDIIGLQGFITLSYGFVYSMARGITNLSEYISNGTFDRFMLSPKNLLLRISTSLFSPSALGDVLFGIICMIFYGFSIHINIIQVIFILILMLLSSIAFFSIYIVIASLGFYFTDATVITDGAFQFFFTPSIFNGGAFQGLTRFIFTFIVPSLLIGTLPVEAVKNISFPKLILIAVLTLFWVFLSTKIFNRAVKKYESSNFMTFGN